MTYELFAKRQIVGVFKGFTEGGLEFHADLVLPYRNDFQNLPMHGQFLLIQLENQDEAVLGRVTSLSSTGKLSSGTGEEFNIRAMQDGRPVPEDLREQYLRYKVNIRVLGVIRNDAHKNKLTFIPSHRRLPHVGSPVAFPTSAVLQWIAGHMESGTPIGHFALGEYIYAAEAENFTVLDWMQVRNPEVLIRFPISNLVSRRSFIFARAGFGKSNLTKLLFSQLYETQPYVTKRNSQQVPVGTIIFDPDGEYFWPDDKGRPGLCDVPYLQNQLVVFTPRNAPSRYYGSFVASGVRLDLRRFNASDVISIALPPEKQGQQNVIKLRGLSTDRWRQLIDLIDRDGNQADLAEINQIMNLDDRQDFEALAARSNMTMIVRWLHDSHSLMLDILLAALRGGRLCIVDISLLQGQQSFILSALILRQIFDINQQEFTKADPQTIPTIAVIEEAQSVLNQKESAAEPFIAWIKEGRKYDLGAMLITQQPGSIGTDILSQGDNWFIFHLLSATDLTNVSRANAHFSEDILAVLLNEPIPGQGVFWSSASGKSYPIPIRTLSFEEIFEVADPFYQVGRQDNYASQLRSIIIEEQFGEDVDHLEAIWQRAIEHFRQDDEIQSALNNVNGVPWGRLNTYFLQFFPETWQNRDNDAYRLVANALNQIFGPQGTGWETFKQRNGAVYVRTIQVQ